MTLSLGVRCQNCGATLRISEERRFITCAYCHSDLEVIRNESAVHTQVLKEVVTELETMRTKLKKLEIQREIDLLDREWLRDKQDFYMSGKHGGTYEPTVGRGVAEIALGVVAVVLLNVLAMHSTRPNTGAGTLGVLLCIVLTISGAYTISKARALEAAHSKYQGKRNALLQELVNAGE